MRTDTLLRRAGTLALALAFCLLAPTAHAQCTKSMNGITIELVLDGRNTGGSYTYVWDVSYSRNEPWVTDIYFQRAPTSQINAVSVEPHFTTWVSHSVDRVDTQLDAVRFLWQSGLKLQRGRTFTFAYTTAFQDPVVVWGLLSNGSTFEFTFTSSECAILPVELVSFEARVDGSEALLSWRTASETNNAGFRVEHRASGGAFAEAGFVRGFGTTAEAQAYSFRTGALAPGRHAFRLRQVDHDGRFAYSPEVEVEVGLDGAFRVGPAYPNPSAGRARFEVTVQRTQRVTAEAYDALGRVVARVFEGTLEAGSPEALTVDGASLAPGVYVLRVVGETFRHAQQLTVVR